MWNRVLLLSLAFSFVRTTSVPNRSSKAKAKASKRSLVVEDIDYVDEALKSVSREVKEFSFGEDEDASWFIEPTTSLSPLSVSTAAQTPCDNFYPRKRMKFEKSTLSCASSLPAKSSLSASDVGVSPLFSSTNSSAPSSTGSIHDYPSLKTKTFTLKAPPTPNLLELDLTVDVPVIEAWLLYKYRLASGNHLATAVDYGRLYIRGWPNQAPIIRANWDILQVIYLKEAVVDAVEFDFTGNSTIDSEENARVEMMLKRALNVPESDQLDWNAIRPFIWKFLTSTNSAQWNEQDRMRVIDMIDTINRMRNALKKKSELEGENGKLY